MLEFLAFQENFDSVIINTCFNLINRRCPFVHFIPRYNKKDWKLKIRVSKLSI